MQRNFLPLTTRLSRPLAIAALGLLAACGGGGSSGGSGTTEVPVTPPPTPTLDATLLQGRWATGAGVATPQTAVIVPAAAGSTAMSMWLLSADLQALAKLDLTTSGANGVTAQGKSYALGTTTAPLASSRTGTADLTAATLTLDGGTLVLARSDTLSGAISVADLAGAWSSSAGGGVVTTSWAIAADGAATGSSSTGCSYTGRLTPRGGVGVLDATLGETCAGTSRSFSGIATVRRNTAGLPSSVTWALVNTDVTQSSALAIVMAR